MRNLKKSIKDLRSKIEDDHKHIPMDYGLEWTLKYYDDFLNSDLHTDLQKVLFLVLHQYPSEDKTYVIRPDDMVFVPDIYHMSGPGIEYRIDFALYSGTIDNPVKIAIECNDNCPEQNQHYSGNRKLVNLQGAGWIVMHFGLEDISDELQKFEADESHIFDCLNCIENTITEKARFIDNHSFSNDEYRSKLTGYKWGFVTCSNCHHEQMDILNYKILRCRKCNTEFEREIKPDEQIWYERDGFLFFRR